ARRRRSLRPAPAGCRTRGSGDYCSESTWLVPSRLLSGPSRPLCARKHSYHFILTRCGRRAGYRWMTGSRCVRRPVLAEGGQHLVGEPPKLLLDARVVPGRPVVVDDERVDVHLLLQLRDLLDHLIGGADDRAA